MKNRFMTFIFIIALVSITLYKLDDISNLLANYFNNTETTSVEEKNQYAKEENYEYVQISDSYTPYNYQELLNVFYTILDAGYDTYTFYCPAEYSDCISDVENISDTANVSILTNLSSYVSPYNNFSSLKVKYDTAGEVTVDVTHLYSEEDIIKISNKIDTLWKELVTQGMSNEDIIYAFHDYIINNSKYDENYDKELAQGITPTYHSASAIGPLFEGYAICSGYTDTMALVLDKLGIKNFKVTSDTHVWNALYINGEWLNLDLTWDDPVSEDRTQNNLLHKFFLIDTNTLESFQISDHNYNKSVYLELN
ncbi:MAG TPA: hypothetical protein PLB45_04390 [Bacilli bacterium]|nr:hypothetical protein [Bacilli bacterium]